MNRKVVALILFFSLSGVAGWGTSRVLAVDPPGQPEGPSTQAETLFGGAPVYNVMKTEVDALAMGSTAVNAFTPIMLPCPASAGANGCTIRVEVTSQFQDIPATAVGQMILSISGAGTLGPAPTANVVSGVGSLAETRSMQWVKKNVPAGTTVTITTQFKTIMGTGSAGFRTMSIDIFNGLL